MNFRLLATLGVLCHLLAIAPWTYAQSRQPRLQLSQQPRSARADAKSSDRAGQSTDATSVACLGSDPFWPDLKSPKLVTPDWFGEAGVDAVVILAIDDLRVESIQKYESFLRPILDELKQDGDRAPLSIMTCTVKRDDPQLQTWLKEGVSIEVHTLKHPCPLLHDGDLQMAKETVDGCIDLLHQVPHNSPVAFRTPCCDSMSSPSPRLFSEILAKATPLGHALAIDSSVMCLLTPQDQTLPREWTTNQDGSDRFRKYFPQQRTDKTRSLANFGTYIEDYPYPYLINGKIWELPCMVPSDWEAFNLHGANNPATIADWKAALDAVVHKQGVFTFIFHPHGWIKAEQVVEFIRCAREKYGKRVRFINFAEAHERLGKNVSAQQKQKVSAPTKPLKYPLPAGVALIDAKGRDNGVRFVDLNGDGYDDVVFSNSERYGVYLFNPVEKKGVDWRVGWTFIMREGKAGDANSIPPLVRANGASNGVWFKHGAMWVQNEDTTAMLDKVQRIPFDKLLKQPGPPPRTPPESLHSIHLKPGFTAELVAAEPLVQDPIFIDWDARGRMWIVEMADYPFHEQQGQTFGGRVKVLEATRGDGVYDKATIFLDNLTYPSGLACWKNGVFVASVPEVFFAECTQGDGPADKHTPILQGFKQGNPQHLVNGFAWGLDGWYYGGNGDSGGTITDPTGSKKHDLSGRDFRFNPRTGEFQLQSGKAQFGRWRDDFGNWFANNNSSIGWHYFIDDHYLARNSKLAVRNIRQNLNPGGLRVYSVSPPIPRLNQPDSVNTLTSGCSLMPYRDTLFGDEYAHNFFECEPANNLVHREVLEPDSVSFTSHRAGDEQQCEFLASEDNWSRFTQARTGPDGCLYVVDMYRLILEHPEWIPKPMLDHLDVRAGSDMGRIYRIRPTDKKLPPTPNLAAMADDELGQMLQSTNGWVRDTAQRLLIERSAQWKCDALTGAVAARIQQLWTLHTLGTLKSSLLCVAMRDKVAAVRENAVRIAERYLDDADVLTSVCQLAGDEELRVRVQVAFSLGESKDARVAEVLSGLAKRDFAATPMLVAVLSSAPDHPEARQWQAMLSKLQKGNESSPPAKIITSSSPDRDKVVKAFAGVAQLTGDAQRGHALYTAICSNCHRLKNEGHDAGPDLATVANKPTEQLIEAILDPSRAVEERYLARVVSLNDGKQLVGLIVEETANSITLKTLTSTEVILRSEIDSNVTSKKSFMPDGVENLLNQQQLADVIAWIRQK